MTYPDLKSYLPNKFKELCEFDAICDTEQVEKENIIGCMNDDTDDFYIPSATEEGMSRWETIMGITPRADATIDERRYELSARVNNRIPYTYRRIISVLDTLMGSENYTFTPEWEAFTLEVDLSLGTKYQLDSVKSLLNNILPAHIDVLVDLIYNTYQVVGEHTHSYLSTKTYQEVKEEELL